VLAGNGSTVYAVSGADKTLGKRVSLTNFPLKGVNPPPSERPPTRYDVPCETQQRPDLSTIPGAPPVQQASGQFSPLQAALNRANQFEGVADNFKREGKPDLAQRWYQRALSIRTKSGLLGKQWDIRGGKLAIVATGEKKLSLGGAPLVPPFLRTKGKANAG
jgi:hypothetical protein